MRLFKRKDETALAVKEPPVTVAVPDIKQYLIDEYERVADLKAKLEIYEERLDIARETDYKYKATLVTLDEYSKRLKHSEELLEKEKSKTEQVRQEVAIAKDELNTYKIMLHDAALTKEAIRDEIISEFKAGLVEKINGIKGNLSKNCVLEVINCQ